MAQRARCVLRALLDGTLPVLLAVIALALPSGAMYVPSLTDAPPTAPPGEAAEMLRTPGKCIHGHADPHPPAMAISMTTVTPAVADTTESPPAVDSTDVPATMASAVGEVLQVNVSAVASRTSASSMVSDEQPLPSDAEETWRDVEDSLNELFDRASSNLGRYASGFSQARSLFHRRMAPPTPPPLPLRPNQEPPEITKDVYVHLAADEPSAPATRAPLPLPPRKHYKIIVIKPPTPAPAVETTTRGVDVETLIYVLVPKGEAPTAPPTTPRTPSKHEVYFIRYKAPSSASSSSESLGPEPTLSVNSATTTSTTARPVPQKTDYSDLVDLRSAGSEVRLRAASDEDENELDGTVRDSDELNDLLGVSSDDIVRSWRRADGDLHFDADLRRIARSHSIGPAAGSEAPEAPASSERCREYATAEDLNAALDTDGGEGKRVQGGPDFEAVLQGRAHYGRSVEICAEKVGSEPFAIRDFPAQTDESAREETHEDIQTNDVVGDEQNTKPNKFSARYTAFASLAATR